MIEWWIRGTLTASSVEQVAACQASAGPQGDVTCLLFDGHPGRHLFELSGK
jgi:hypothetical protein